MNRVIITDEEKNTIIDINNKELSGCSFYFDGRKKEVSYDDLKVFNSFFLSKDNKKLPNEGKYRVVLDNKTGFKHYFLGKNEDFVMFYLNNGENAALYKQEEHYIKDNGWKKEPTQKEKFFNVGKRIIRCTCLSLLSILLAVSICQVEVAIQNPEVVRTPKTVPMVRMARYFVETKEDVSSDILIAKLYESQYLTDEQSCILSNKEFFDDIVPYVNASDYAKFLYKDKFDNIIIRRFDGTAKKMGGFHMPLDPNSIYISDQAGDGYVFNDILIHEFIHLCQCNICFNVISDACAEIFKEEYFNYAVATYNEAVYVTKKLMEIIGPEPILEYNFSGNDNAIIEAVRPYLSESDLKTFISTLKMKTVDESDYNNDEMNAQWNLCDKLLDKIYENKFGVSAENDPVIPYLKNERLVRWYFNHRMTEKYGSYVYVSKGFEEEIKLDTAIKQGLVMPCYVADTGEIVRISVKEYEDGDFPGNEISVFPTENASILKVYSKDDTAYLLIERFIHPEEVELPTIEEKLGQMEAKLY